MFLPVPPDGVGRAVATEEGRGVQFYRVSYVHVASRHNVAAWYDNTTQFHSDISFLLTTAINMYCSRQPCMYLLCITWTPTTATCCCLLLFSTGYFAFSFVCVRPFVFATGGGST